MRRPETEGDTRKGTLTARIEQGTQTSDLGLGRVGALAFRLGRCRHQAAVGAEEPDPVVAGLGGRDPPCHRPTDTPSSRSIAGRSRQAGSAGRTVPPGADLPACVSPARTGSTPLCGRRGRRGRASRYGPCSRWRGRASRRRRPADAHPLPRRSRLCVHGSGRRRPPRRRPARGKLASAGFSSPLPRRPAPAPRSNRRRCSRRRRSRSDPVPP